MSGYPLQAALTMRRRQEQAARGRLEAARGIRTVAETRADSLREACETARAALEAARTRDASGPGVTSSAVDEVARDRFINRLRDAQQRADAAYAGYAAGALREARQAEDEASRAYGEARRACEALTLHEENFRHEERRARDRREEDEAEEAARAARHHAR